MGFRITTNMMMNSYRYNLQNSTQKLSDARDKVLTHRNFNSYAEDPAAATQEFRLRRDFYQTSNQITNTKDVYSKFNTAWENIQGMLKDLINPMEKVSAIRGNNGTAGESRKALAQVLRSTSESMIQGFNQQLGDHFIFAGNDGLNAPFEWKGDELYFRGVNVNTDDEADLAKLKEMAGEEMYIDLGMGAKEKGANNPVKGTYFNSALSGLNYTGYGVDEDGDSKNFAILMKQLADVFDSWGENGQRYLPEEYRDRSYEDIQAILDKGGPEADAIESYHSEQEAKAFRLMDKLKAAQEALTAEHVQLDAQSSYLQTNQSRLELQSTNINMEILDVKQVDLAQAITDFSWDQYCYNAALKIGNQLLSQSLIDYMN